MSTIYPTVSIDVKAALIFDHYDMYLLLRRHASSNDILEIRQQPDRPFVMHLNQKLTIGKI